MIVRAIPRSIRIRVDSLSVPKTIGTGPIMMTPPPRTCPVPLTDLRIATRMASTPTANPTSTRSSPMLKRRLPANSAPGLTAPKRDIGFPRTEPGTSVGPFGTVRREGYSIISQDDWYLSSSERL